MWDPVEFSNVLWVVISCTSSRESRVKDREVQLLYPPSYLSSSSVQLDIGWKHFRRSSLAVVTWVFHTFSYMPSWFSRMKKDSHHELVKKIWHQSDSNEDRKSLLQLIKETTENKNPRSCRTCVRYLHRASFCSSSVSGWGGKVANENLFPEGPPLL